MSNLIKVLVFKIVLTVCIWSIPLLVFPFDLLTALGFPVCEPTTIFLRLLGMAYFSLVVGYGLALRSARRGVYPRPVVWVGIVSNGGAFALLSIGAYFNTWASWGAYAQIVMWVSLVGTGSITAGLVMWGPLAHPLSSDQ